VFALMLGFFVHYLCFIYFPVQGPRYLFPPPGGEAAGGFFQALAHRVLEAGSAQGAAFPSSHVGVSVVQTLVAARFLPRLAPLLALLTLGLALGAVYGGFHYAIDAVVGALLGVAVFVIAAPLQRRMSRTAAAPRDAT
jgi:membrane-associated phospholipid phosphatase